MTDKPDLDELARLLAVSTPGGWRTEEMDQGVQLWSGSAYIGETRDYTGDDAALIVALRNAAPSLIAEVEALRGEVARLEASNKALEHAVIKAAAPDYMTDAERKALHDFIQFLRSSEGAEARAALGEDGK